MAIDITVFKGSPSGKIVKDVTHKDDIAGDDVLVEVTHSGICGTESHCVRMNMVLGHEGVGVILMVGPDVKRLKVYVAPCSDTIRCSLTNLVEEIG